MRAVDAHADLCLASAWVRDEHRVETPGTPCATLVSSDIDQVVSRADVLIDFSLPDATLHIVDAILRRGRPLVCGVSGLGDEQLACLDRAAAVVAVVYDRNMSAGVALLENLVRQAAATLGPEFQAQIHETHHIHKQDSPSGTALKLGEVVAAARAQDFREVVCFEPQKGSHALSAGDILIEAERRGDVTGDHSVTLASSTERLVLSHSVTNRQVFADGALRAARWVTKQKPGRYQMKDVLLGK